MYSSINLSKIAEHKVYFNYTLSLKQVVTEVCGDEVKVEEGILRNKRKQKTTYSGSKSK